MNIFEKATKVSLRFPTCKGNVTVEDVWQMPLEGATYNLDVLAMQLHKIIRDKPDTVSFVNPEKPDHDNHDQLRFDIVKHIIDVRLQERENASQRALNAAKKQQILDILKRKQDAGLEEKSEDELKALLKDL